MAAAADPIGAIAGAIGSISSTVGIFAQKAAQKLAYTKGSEVEGISIERQKSLAAYQSLSVDRKTMMYLIIGLTVVIVAFSIYKTNKNK